MSKTYGKGPYGQGKYSALTAFTTTAAQGSYTLTGKAALLPLVGSMAAVRGTYTLTGNAAGINALSWAVAAGSYSLSGQTASFSQSNLWTPETDNSATWTPQTTSGDPWTAVVAGSTTWTPNP